MAVALAEEVARERCREVAVSRQSQALTAVKVVMAAREALVASQVNGLSQSRRV